MVDCSAAAVTARNAKIERLEQRYELAISGELLKRVDHQDDTEVEFQAFKAGDLIALKAEIDSLKADAAVCDGTSATQATRLSFPVRY